MLKTKEPIDPSLPLENQRHKIDIEYADLLSVVGIA